MWIRAKWGLWLLIAGAVMALTVPFVVHRDVYRDAYSGLVLKVPYVFRADTEQNGTFQCRLRLPWRLGSALLISLDAPGFDERIIEDSICSQLIKTPELELHDVCEAQLAGEKGVRFQYAMGGEPVTCQWHFFENGQHIVVYFAGSPMGMNVGIPILERALAKATFVKPPNRRSGFMETPAHIDTQRVMAQFDAHVLSLSDELNAGISDRISFEQLEALMSQGANINGCSESAVLLDALEQDDLVWVDWLLGNGIDLMVGQNAYPRARRHVRSAEAQAQLDHYLAKDPRYRALNELGNESLMRQYERDLIMED
ncbi:MAG: hypothetical protein KDC35_17425 [Acidobacteria bacterium]|nr:hypothetical protein [Acidobacteriota bacterium]